MITIWIEKWRLGTGHAMYCYLRSKGLDISKPFTEWKDLCKPDQTRFQGTALSDRVVGVTKTVIGVVPITKSWEGVE